MLLQEINYSVWIGTLFVPALYCLRKFIQGRQFNKDDVRIDGKVVVITGCNTGIGKETALELATRGGKIYMACRDTTKCEEARMEIIERSGNKNVFNRRLDLESLESVREFVKSFLAEEQRLDILINNAGIMLAPRFLTKDNFEGHIGVNHLAHFLLTNLLLDTIKASAPSRIVNVASSAHMFGRCTKLKNDFMYEKSYSKTLAYAQSKLANILFTRELAKRLAGTGVTTYALHPGVVNTELFRYIPGNQVITFVSKFFIRTAKSGAQTTITVALDPDLAEVSGKYFNDCRIASETKAARNDETAEWLWRESQKLTGLLVNDNSAK